MKILIDNTTTLSNKEAGEILDILTKNQEANYYGKWNAYELNYKYKKIHIETLMMKRYFKVFIKESEIKC